MQEYVELKSEVFDSVNETENLLIGIKSTVT